MRRQKMVVSSVWGFERWRHGILLSKQTVENLVPDQVINHLLDVVFSNGTQIANWYLALFSNDHTPLATHTYASPGYTENTGYDEATRPAWSEGGVSMKSITNSANKASFTMDGTNPNIYGASLVSDNTKGDTAASGAILGPVAQISTPLTGIMDDEVIKVYCTINGADGT